MNVAVLENDIVVNIMVCPDDYVVKSNELIYTDANPAHIGGDYVDGKFYPPKPYSKWIRDNGNWIAPKPYPDPLNIDVWFWDDTIGEWIQ